MITPLRYQLSNHDCGTATMENALSYMIPRQYFPPELVHYINIFLLDGYTKQGWGFYGTNHEAMSFFASWLGAYFDQHKHFKMHVEFYKNEAVTIDSIKEKFNENAKKKICAVVYNYAVWGHYILVTGFTADGDVKVFDPWYIDISHQAEAPFTIVADHPCEYNRIVSAADFASDSTSKLFALGPYDEREAFYLIKDPVVRKKRR